jgi:hypothetical protein
VRRLELPAIVPHLLQDAGVELGRSHARDVSCNCFAPLIYLHDNRAALVALKSAQSAGRA